MLTRFQVSAPLVPSLNPLLPTTLFIWLCALFMTGPASAQTIIWEEDFSGPNKGWTDNFTDCDGTPESFAGVQNNRYEVIDMEGAPCCGVGGGKMNEWVMDPIDISPYCYVVAYIDYGFTNTVDCVPLGPYFGCTGNPAIDDGHDQIRMEYSMDGGPWQQFCYICGMNPPAGTCFMPNVSGNTLQIRILPSNNAVDEMYWFDNIQVVGFLPPTANPVPDVTVCAGTPVNIAFSGSSPLATYNWTNDNPATGLPASGAGNLVFTAMASGTPEIAHITVTPYRPNCPGIPISFTITVNPKPTVDDPSDVSVCAKDPVAVTFTGSPGPTFNWTNNNPAIGLPASGTGNISFTAANVTTVQMGTVTVTPVENGCTGTPQTFKITVTPIPTLNQPANITVCAGGTVQANFTGTPGGVTFNWTNDNSATGLAASGSGNILFTGAAVTAPEVSTVTVTPQIGICTGAPRTFKITVNPIPMVDDPPDLVVCSGKPVDVAFAGSLNATFAWTNDNPAIGLAASGTGSIHFTAAPVSGTQTATITVTPGFAGCMGQPQTFSITVNETPAVTPVPNLSVCGNGAVDVAFSGTPGAVFNWTNNNPSIGIGASGSGDLHFTAAPVTAAQTAVFSITPEANGCTGATRIFVLTVLPPPAVDPVADRSVCAGAEVSVAFSGTAGATFNWTNDNPAIGLPSNGTGNLDFIAVGPQTATLIVTPALGACPGVADTFHIAVGPTPVAAATGPGVVCQGDTATLTATGGAAFLWSTLDTVPTIVVQPDSTQAYSVTVSSGNGCSATATITVAVIPFPAPNISGGGAICPGDTVVLTATGAEAFFWSTGDTTASISVHPATAAAFTVTATNAGLCAATATAAVAVWPADSTFLNALSCNAADTGTVTQIRTNQYGCDSVVVLHTQLAPSNAVSLTQLTCNPNNAGVFTQELSNQYGCDSIVVTTVLFDPAAIDTTYTNAYTCNPAQAGVTQTLYPGANGCDSLVITTTVFIAADTTMLSGATCDPSAAGVFIQGLHNQYGCDSTVITTIALLPSDSVFLSETTCHSTAAGVFVQHLVNQYGCDSTVVTTIVFDPALLDTTLLHAVTCDAALAGVQQNLLTGADGCDSLVILVTELLPSQSDSLTQYTCHPAEAGVFAQQWSNQYGCDSTVVTTVIFDPALLDTTYVALTTCDSSLAGVLQMLLTGVDGCDSLVIQTTALLPSQAIQVTQLTCNPNNAGVFMQELSNQYGCDSTVVTTVIFDPAAVDTTYVNASSCDPAQAGVTQLLLVGADGCDSLVITTTTALPVDSVSLTAFTCHPLEAGVFTQQLTNQYGCDSLVVTNTVLLTSDTTFILLGTCDSALTDTVVQVLVNQFGCDSVVVTTTTLLPPAACTVTALLDGSSILCDALTGSLTLTVTSGEGPFAYSVTPGGITGALASTGTPLEIGGLPAGLYTVVVTAANGLSTTLTAPVIQLKPPELTLEALTNYGGYGVSCAGAADGALQVIASGGSGPYDFSWSTGSAAAQLTGLPAGLYSVTATDANGCTAVASQSLTGPLPLSIGFLINRPACFGDKNGSITVQPLGGVPPLRYALNGGPLQSAPVFDELSAGAYSVSAIDANDCSANEIILINAPLPLNVSLGADQTIELGDDLTLTALVNVPYDSLAQVAWSPIDSVECPQCLSQLVAPIVTTTYSVLVADQLGCTAGDQVMVHVDRRKHLYVPNVFSPNGDGRNDKFTIFAKPNTVTRIKSFRIFNRWGEAVAAFYDFEPNNLQVGWDGTFRGQPLNPAVFAWLAEVEFVDGVNELFTGDVTLVR